MKLLHAPKKQVGIFAAIALAILGLMAIGVGDSPELLGGGKRYHFRVADASGLIKGSKVKMSGIPVGVIKSIQYEGGQAKITIAVPDDYPLYASAKVRIKSQGILGDKYIDISPGNSADTQLAEGDQILIVQDMGSLDQLVGQVSQISESIKIIANNLAEAVSEDGTNRHVLGRIVRNVEKLTADISEIAADNKEQIGDIVDNLQRVTASLDEILNDPSPKGLKNRLQVAMERLDNSLKNIEEITGKINKGEGTLGKLISDENTSDVIENTLDSIDVAYGGVSSLQMSLNLQSQYLAEMNAARTTVGLLIEPGPDRHYFIGITDDPAGVVDITETKTTVGNSTTETREERRYLSKTQFNLWFGKTFYNLTVRAGLIQSSAGVGLDYSFWGDRFVFTTELLEFRNLNLRAHLQARLVRGLYVMAGGQDLLGQGKKQSGYLGLNLLLTNDDLIMLSSRLSGF
ncbi:MAG: MlaD family protein [Bdellovibrionaceae bacterium]|jgi:phospholipid/cholesterol/gamma-HCH transport system substrate-binding protein|nr:MlaD family protein [Pseudobdellovibrionaceae bacterium]